MKFLFLFFLPVLAFGQAQKYFQADSIKVDSNQTINGRSHGSVVSDEKFYQTWVDLISTKIDTIKVQQFMQYGGGTTRDSAWVTMKVYNSWASETPDTLVVTHPVPNAKCSHASFLLWAPFIGERWRIVRVSTTFTPAHVLYYFVSGRFWSTR